MSAEIRRRGVFILVGCGAAKRDTDEPVPVRDLYTSNYFGLKRRFAEAATQWAGTNQSSAWAILSAEHGILPHGMEVETYETTVDDLEGTPVSQSVRGTMPNGEEPATELDWWAQRCASALETWLRHPFQSANSINETPCGQLLVLAGRRYIDPLVERGAFEGTHNGLPVKPRFPFEEQELSGIGEQMAWLKAEAERLETEHTPARRAELGLSVVGTNASKHYGRLTVQLSTSRRASNRRSGTSRMSLTATDQPSSANWLPTEETNERRRTSPPHDDG